MLSCPGPWSPLQHHADNVPASWPACRVHLVAELRGRGGPAKSTELASCLGFGDGPLTMNEPLEPRWGRAGEACCVLGPISQILFQAPAKTSLSLGRHGGKLPPGGASASPLVPFQGKVPGLPCHFTADSASSLECRTPHRVTSEVLVTAGQVRASGDEPDLLSFSSTGPPPGSNVGCNSDPQPQAPLPPRAGPLRRGQSPRGPMHLRRPPSGSPRTAYLMTERLDLRMVSG